MAVADGVLEGVILAVAVLVRELLPVFEGEAPGLSEAVDEVVNVVLADTVLLAVPEGGVRARWRGSTRRRTRG